MRLPTVLSQHRPHREIFAFAFLLSLGLLLPASKLTAGTPGAGSDSETVVMVDGRALHRQQFERHFDRALGQYSARMQSLGNEVGIQRVWALRLDAFEQTVVTDLLLREAERLGITLSETEIQERATALADEELAGIKTQAHISGADIETVLGALVGRAEGRAPQPMTEGDFRAWLKNRVLMDSESLREELAVAKLRDMTTKDVTATEADLLASYDRATVRQILVAFRPDGKPERTEEQAKERADTLYEQAKGGADFAELVRAESDDRETASMGGSRYEPLRRGIFAPDLDAVIFSLAPGQISPPLKDERGYWIFRMESITREMPQGYETQKEQLLKDFVSGRRALAWLEYEKQLRARAAVSVLAPEIRAYQALRAGKGDETLSLLQVAVEQAPTLRPIARASILYQLAVSMSARDRWQEAAAAYAACDDAITLGQDIARISRVQVLLGRGRAQQHLGNKAQAIEFYDLASASTQIASVHEDLVHVYEQIGAVDQVERERRWLQAYREALIAKERAAAAEERAASRRAKTLLPRPEKND